MTLMVDASLSGLLIAREDVCMSGKGWNFTPECREQASGLVGRDGRRARSLMWLLRLVWMSNHRGVGCAKPGKLLAAVMLLGCLMLTSGPSWGGCAWKRRITLDREFLEEPADLFVSEQDR